MAQEIADSKLIDTWGSSGAKIEPDISKIIEGWQLGEQPPHEYMNWLQNTFGSKLNHILKNGVASWNNETEYLAGASVQHNGNVWICQEINVNSEPTELNNKWGKIPSIENLALTVDTIDDFPSSASTGDTCIVKDLDRGGIFIYDSTKVSEDNGGTNFNGWIRQYSGAVNVKWFGAKGDGVTSASLSINSSLAAVYAAGGGTVLVPAGNYRLTSILKIGGNTTLKCDTCVRFLKDHDATFINNGLGFDTLSVIPAYGGHGNIVIDGGTWEGFAFGRFDGYTGLALGYGKNIVVKNIILKDSIGPGHAVDMSCCDDVLFENCKFLGYAADASDPSTQDCIQLDHNVEGSFPYFGVPVFKQNRNITVRGCTFGPNPDNADVRFGSHYIGVGAHGSVHNEWHYNITIEDCIFEGSRFAAIRPWKISNLKVLNCDFRGGDRGIHITGTSANSVSSQDADRVQSGEAQSSYDITIHGNRFSGFPDAAIFSSEISFGTDTSIRHENIIVTDNVFSANTGENIRLRSVRGLTVSGNISEQGGDFIHVRNASELVNITDNTIRSAQTTAASACVFLDGATDVSVCDNKFYRSRKRSILVAGGAGILIANNHIREHGTSGPIDAIAISVEQGADDGLVTGNLIRDVANGSSVAIFASSSTSNIDIIDNIVINANKPAYGQSVGGVVSCTLKTAVAATPEGAIGAQPGSVCRNQSDGRLYVKQSGTGTTGWVAK